MQKRLKWVKGLEELDELFAILFYEDGEVCALEAVECLEELKPGQVNGGVLEGGVVGSGLVDAISDFGRGPQDFCVGTMRKLGAGFGFHGSRFLSFLFVA